MQAAEKIALYQLLLELPETLTGELLNGQLHTQPRPTGPHATTGSRLGYELIGPFDRGRGGPGGWWIIDEPEVHFVEDTEVAVPDIGGWRRERMPQIPRDHRFRVAPDWICEILSPSTASKDREIKMPIYAHYGVAYAWLIDPVERILEAYELISGQWSELGRFSGHDRVAVAPFDVVTIELGGLWA
jgi:Uma2 family endonuclease